MSKPSLRSVFASDPEQQKHFVWSTNPEGIELHHTSENPSYIISWSTFYSVFDFAFNLASKNNNIATAGTSMITPGSVGAWVINQNLPIISNGNLTPRHLSFLGPIYGIWVLSIAN